MNTTILVSDATRDILAKGRDRFTSPSLDAYIRVVLRDATPMAQDLWKAHRKKAEEICKAHKVKRLIAFGSRVRDDRHPASDLDLVVEMPKTGDITELFKLQDEFADLFGVKVDLGDLPRPDSRLWKHIREDGVALVGPDP